MTRTEKMRLIRKAWDYNSKARDMASCNHLYMGSISQCLLFHALGADWPNVSLAQAMNAATDAQLDAGLERCQNILKYATR